MAKLLLHYPPYLYPYRQLVYFYRNELARLTTTQARLGQLRSFDINISF
jgi:hypothetical protein